MPQASARAGMIEGGFADPVHDAQRVFTSVMNAFARPGTVEAVSGFAAPPEPMNAAAGAICAALCDADTPVWLVYVPWVVVWVNVCLFPLLLPSPVLAHARFLPTHHRGSSSRLEVSHLP